MHSVLLHYTTLVSTKASSIFASGQLCVAIARMAQSLAVYTALPSSCFLHSRALCLNLKSSFKHLKVVVQGWTVVLCARRAGQLPRTKPIARRAGVLLHYTNHTTFH